MRLPFELDRANDPGCYLYDWINPFGGSRISRRVERSLTFSTGPSSAANKLIRAENDDEQIRGNANKYKHVKMERRDSILQFTLHTNGGPVIWD